MNAPRIVTRLMYEVEYLRLDNEELRFKNGQYRIALFGCEVEPQSPFPLLGGEDLLDILHPHDGDRPCRRR